jgi:hypothetical protein
VIIFGSVRFLSKKITKPKFVLKKPKPGQTNWFQFGSVFLGKKPVQTGLAPFFQFWLGFFSGFFRFRFGSVLLVFCL